MKLNQILNEVPLAGYKTLSDTPKSKRGDPNAVSDKPEDFEKRSSSYTDKRDRRLITNPHAVKRLKNIFASDIPVDFYFYMVNTKEGRDFTEIGKVTRDWLKKNMPGVEPYIEDHEDSITVIFTNNKGDQKIPMTPWIMAHRIGHAFQRGRESPFLGHRYISQYTDTTTEINRVIDTLLINGYGVRKPTGNKEYYSYSDNNFAKARKKFYEAIGTFRSARKGKLRADFEFINELIAQYLITGEIKFNQIPKSFKANGFHYRFKASDEEYEDSNDELQMLARDLEYYVDNILSQAVNGIYVM